jgi:hypothetical protein
MKKIKDLILLTTPHPLPPTAASNISIFMSISKNIEGKSFLCNAIINPNNIPTLSLCPC